MIATGGNRAQQVCHHRTVLFPPNTSLQTTFKVRRICYGGRIYTTLFLEFLLFLCFLLLNKVLSIVYWLCAVFMGHWLEEAVSKGLQENWTFQNWHFLLCVWGEKHVSSRKASHVWSLITGSFIVRNYFHNQGWTIFLHTVPPNWILCRNVKFSALPLLPFKVESIGKKH